MAAGGRSHADTVLLTALASGQTIEAAAQIAHISERTARRRLDDETFQRALAEARRALLAQALGVLSDATTAAARTLRALLDAESESVRVRAAVAILDQARAGIELDDLAQRVEALGTMSETWEPPTPGRGWRG
jgi:hypothetical protein